MDGDSQGFIPLPAHPPKPRRPYFSKGDHAGSDAKPGVLTCRSLRPVRSTV
jgi:hypothetical protein